MEKVFGIDVSLYQKHCDFKVLQDNGVSFVIMKASSGSGIDPRFAQHMLEAEAGPNIVIGAYHWSDPTVNDITQAKMFADILNANPRIKFACVDVEQWWADWALWWKMLKNEVRPDEVPKLTTSRINDNALNVLDYITKNTNKKVFIYTAKWFVDYYCLPMQSWISKYNLWVATYPTVYKYPTTWQELFDTMPPAGTKPYMPRGSTDWKIWQWTDRIKLPGVYTDDKQTMYSAVDTNVWNGTPLQFAEFFKVEYKPTLDERVVKLETEAKAHGWVLTQ